MSVWVYFSTDGNVASAGALVTNGECELVIIFLKRECEFKEMLSD